MAFRTRAVIRTRHDDGRDVVDGTSSDQPTTKAGMLCGCASPSFFATPASPPGDVVIDDLTEEEGAAFLVALET